MTARTYVWVVEVFDADGDRDDLYVHATREGALDEAEVALGRVRGWSDRPGDCSYELHQERLWGGGLGSVAIVPQEEA